MKTFKVTFKGWYAYPNPIVTVRAEDEMAARRIARQDNPGCGVILAVEAR